MVKGSTQTETAFPYRKFCRNSLARACASPSRHSPRLIELVAYVNDLFAYFPGGLADTELGTFNFSAGQGV